MYWEHLRNVWRSTTFHLGLLFMVLFAASFLIIGGFVYRQTMVFLEQEMRATIDVELNQSRQFYLERGEEIFLAEIEGLAELDPSGIYIILDDACQALAGGYKRLDDDESIQEICTNAPDTDGWVLFELDIPRGFRAQIPEWDDNVYARIIPIAPNRQLLYGRMGGNIDSAREVVQSALAWGLAAMGVLAVLGSYLMAGSIAGRLEQINRISQEIRHGDLSRRMPLRRGSDEFDRLSGNLNRMLDQIQTLMEGVRSVSDAIAHDLRTPLARLRTRLERLRKVPPGEVDAGVAQSIQETDSMLATFNALLSIAQLEAGSRRTEFADVDMQALMVDIVDLYEPVASEKDIDLRLEQHTAVSLHGDRNLLFQAISNLVDNAVKYTPEGGRVQLELLRRGQGLRLMVSDSGPGIPSEERDRVFERFYRLDAHRDLAGNGLGLTLVAAVAKLHDSRVELQDNDPGLRVVWNLPRGGSRS
ncbi:MAG: HAMP domain-containing histidine kinase [Proteobacteria bacterium]|nr:HAMP domain-containing histidine kinase [Pseudomonadota bacterium]